jgi:GNAT superfamily N-acetyltransferase
MSDAVIRRATPQDAEALSRIAKDTFVETFGHLYPADELRAFLDEVYSLDIMRRDLADPAKAAWLVEADGKAVGHALAGPCDLPHPEVTPACGELKRLYLLKAHQHGGVGTKLLREALGWLGERRLWVGVWSENYGAQRLYSRYGFEKVGEYDFPVGRVRDREFIMATPANA